MTRDCRPPRLAAPALGLALTLALAACGPATPRSTFPPIGTTPQPAGDATAATKQQVIGALSAAGLQAADAVRAYRPPEGPLLSAAPRSVLQVALPDDPTHGYIMVYSLSSPADAAAAANDHASYISSNLGKVQFPPGTQFILRTVGSTVVFFHWSPNNSPDERTAEAARVLGSIGSAVEVPG